VGPTGAAVLADVLQNNSSITALNLRQCGIGPLGAYLVADALKNNITLQVRRMSA
jgi:hypothetical protein